MKSAFQHPHTHVKTFNAPSCQRDPAEWGMADKTSVTEVVLWSDINIPAHAHAHTRTRTHTHTNAHTHATTENKKGADGGILAWTIE